MSFRRYGSKFGNKPKTIISKDGTKRTYHSQKEAADARMLQLLLRSGELSEVREQVTIPIVVAGKKVCTHIVDFEVTTARGIKKWVETKGYQTDVWKLKKKLVEALYPETPYLVNPSPKDVCDSPVFPRRS